MPQTRSSTTPVFTQRALSLGRMLVYGIGGLGVAAVFIAMAWRFYSFSYAVANPDLPPLLADEVAPMARPDLAAAAPLPLARDLAAVRAAHPDLAAAVLPAWAEGVDAASLAWASAQGDPSVQPPRVGVMELYRARLPLGRAVRVSGRVADPGRSTLGADWRRALIELDEGVWVEAVCPAGLELPAAVELSGSFLGLDDLPTASGPARVAAVLVRAARPASASFSDVRLDASAPDLAAHPAWAAIDDHTTVLERDPYYALLDLVARDGPAASATAEGPPLLNGMAAQVWEDPADFRGRAVRATGRVVRAWEDRLVAADHPHGVTRVVRILLYHRDMGPMARIDKTTGKAVSTQMSVLRLYELAVIGDLPVPAPGEQVLATGRFLKLNARPIDLANARAGSVHGDRAFALFVVAHHLEILDQRGLRQLPMLRIGMVVVSTALTLALVWFTWRGWREHRRLQAKLRAGRAQREAVIARARAPPADGPPIRP